MTNLSGSLGATSLRLGEKDKRKVLDVFRRLVVAALPIPNALAIAYSWLAIGCVGEVRVAEHPDFDKWGLEILVKFRDAEKLQILTGQRQSGGVRIYVLGHNID